MLSFNRLFNVIHHEATIHRLSPPSLSLFLSLSLSLSLSCLESLFIMSFALVPFEGEGEEYERRKFTRRNESRYALCFQILSLSKGFLSRSSRPFKRRCCNCAFFSGEMEFDPLFRVNNRRIFGRYKGLLRERGFRVSVC